MKGRVFFGEQEIRNLLVLFRLSKYMCHCCVHATETPPWTVKSSPPSGSSAPIVGFPGTGGSCPPSPEGGFFASFFLSLSLPVLWLT